MQISDKEVKKILSGDYTIAQEITKIGAEHEEARAQADQTLVADVVDSVVNMPDREDRVAELKAKIESGEYNPTGDEIADAMIRRSIADRVR